METQSTSTFKRLTPEDINPRDILLSKGMYMFVTEKTDKEIKGYLIYKGQIKPESPMTLSFKTMSNPHYMNDMVKVPNAYPMTIEMEDKKVYRRVLIHQLEEKVGISEFVYYAPVSGGSLRMWVTDSGTLLDDVISLTNLRDVIEQIIPAKQFSWISSQFIKDIGKYELLTNEVQMSFEQYTKQADPLPIGSVAVTDSDFKSIYHDKHADIKFGVLEILGKNYSYQIKPNEYILRTEDNRPTVFKYQHYTID